MFFLGLVILAFSTWIFLFIETPEFNKIKKLRLSKIRNIIALVGILLCITNIFFYAEYLHRT